MTNSSKTKAMFVLSYYKSNIDILKIWEKNNKRIKARILLGMQSRLASS
jgi:hypothetical protein